ncbi:DUF397 domain-containing protein [Actinomadura sp. NEAU-AAG7]|uniref:DUF397 domain-containing protein n=1 Tax=Actinomadura sp. NEAU-AAG7 TaxID=2839640 RepID=UPI001BE4D099|nr:DUF397 domain-containing protein [Actinomadura sp. NEAU-AAG7]MBT2207425.1 DUF397 domain-containing protein [Actinomadura sp. NEAU-AAG7]
MVVKEVVWRKSSRSTNNGGACVEVASAPTHIAVRDSKDPQGPHLILRRADFRELADAIKNL